jgi:hypothetical protein
MTDVENKCRDQYHTGYYDIIKIILYLFATAYYLAFHAGT